MEYLAPPSGGAVTAGGSGHHNPTFQGDVLPASENLDPMSISGRLIRRLYKRRLTTMRNSKKTNILLWTIQILLAALVLFAGAMKFLIPAAQLTAQSPFSA